jgi:hypothetical protein
MRNRTSDLAVRQNQLDQVRDVAIVAIREGAQATQIVAQMAAATLAAVQRDIDAAYRDGRMTPYKEQAIYHYREAYKYELLNTLEKAHRAAGRLVESGW